MITISVAVLLIVLLFWFGTGPVLLLLPRQASGRRVLLLPFAGLCAHILFSIALARFDLTGHSISILALTFFSVLACWGLYHAPLSRKEVRASAASLAIGAASMALIAWPLFRAGYAHYWGYANPDQIYLTQVLEWVYRHPFGVPPNYPVTGLAYRGVHENTVLGIFYVITTLATVTGITPESLFNITQSVIIFLTPLGLFLFSETLGLSRRRSLMASSCIACSSLVAYTFCLDSLAASTLISVIPVALASLLESGERASVGDGVLFAGIAAAMFYTYLGAIGVLGILASAIILRLLVHRGIPIYRLLTPVLLTLVFISAAFTPFAYSIARYFMFETFSSRLSLVQPGVAEATAEVMNSFGLPLTEHGIPFFWGLQIPHVAGWIPTDSGVGLSPYMFGAACLFFAIFSFSAWPRISRLSPSYTWILIAAIGPILVYTYTGSAYGVFKLVAWIHPIVVIGFVAATCGIADRLRPRTGRVLGHVPYLMIAAYIAVNAGISYRLGSYTMSSARAGSPQSAIAMSFDDVHQLRTGVSPNYKNNVLVMVPDIVGQRWASGYLSHIKPVLFPELQFLVENSAPRLHRSLPPQAYILGWKAPDITEPPKAAPVWSNPGFSLFRSDELRDAVFLGQGWYRLEGETEHSSSGLPQRRWRWLRKRGEVFIWNPCPGRHRLLLTASAGFGNRRPDRHISLFVNGTKFDELPFSGYGRILSRAFETAAPWSQLEVQVNEDAAVLPRTRALWAKDIPAEPRKLNVAVSELKVVEEDQSGQPLPSSLDLHAEFQAPRTLMEGIYPDRWIGTSAKFWLTLPVNARRLELAGMLPPSPGVSVPFPIEFVVDGRHIGPAVITSFGKFHAAVPVGDLRLHRGQGVPLEVKPSGTFLGQNGDFRRLSIQLDSIGFSE